MKRSIAIWLACLVLFESLISLAIIADYEYHQDFYANVLCINKDKPELACEGKCILMQKLQEVDNPFEEGNDIEVETRAIDWVFKNIVELALFTIETPREKSDMVALGHPQNYIPILFKPPQAV